MLLSHWVSVFSSGSLWLPQASNQTLCRQCTCVGYVRAEHWARFIPVGKWTTAHRPGPPIVRVRWVSPKVRSPQQQIHPPCGCNIKCPCTVGAPAWWAGVNCPWVTNLHLRTSVWHSSNWIEVGWLHADSMWKRYFENCGRTCFFLQLLL